VSKAVFKAEGAKELMDALGGVAPKLAKRLFKKAATQFAAETRDAVRGVIEKNTGNLRKATKSKSTRSGGAVVFVDRSGGASGKGHHAHIHRQGTKARKTKKGYDRGVSPANTRVNKVLDSQSRRFIQSVGVPVINAIKAELAKRGIK
jgi:hypothetical protein